MRCAPHIRNAAAIIGENTYEKWRQSMQNEGHGTINVSTKPYSTKRYGALMRKIFGWKQADLNKP